MPADKNYKQEIVRHQIHTQNYISCLLRIMLLFHFISTSSAVAAGKNELLAACVRPLVLLGDGIKATYQDFRHARGWLPTKTKEVSRGVDAIDEEIFPLSYLDNGSKEIFSYELLDSNGVVLKQGFILGNRDKDGDYIDTNMVSDSITKALAALDDANQKENIAMIRLRHNHPLSLLGFAFGGRDFSPDDNMANLQIKALMSTRWGIPQASLEHHLLVTFPHRIVEKRAILLDSELKLGRDYSPGKPLRRNLKHSRTLN